MECRAFILPRCMRLGSPFIRCSTKGVGGGLQNMGQQPRMSMVETKTGVEGCPVIVLNLGNKRKIEHRSLSSTLASNYGSFESKFRPGGGLS
jgi:hypothetical protein